MERLVNCNIVIEIESVNQIQGGNQYYEVFFSTPENIKYKIIFNYVWDIRCSIESAFIDRASKFLHDEKKKSSILLIQNSDSIKYFEKQVSGTRPISELKNYILFDSIDTVIEVITIKEPVLVHI